MYIPVCGEALNVEKSNILMCTNDSKGIPINE